jgi:hypothetical protein
MGFWNDVNPQTVSQASNGFREFRIGDNYAHISNVVEKVSNSGNPMLEITFVDEDGAEIRYYIVDGEWKLSKLKQLYQAFNIPIGETNIKKWIGKWGIVVCKKGEPYGDKGICYNKVSYVRPVDKVPQTGKPSTPQPQQQEPYQDATPSDDGFEDDIPF